MSVTAISAVWQSVDEFGTQAELLVMLSLADQANEEGYCWPTMGTVARRCKLTERGVRNIVASLEASGWLTVQRTAGGRPREGQQQRGNVFYLNVARLRAVSEGSVRQNRERSVGAVIGETITRNQVPGLGVVALNAKTRQQVPGFQRVSAPQFNPENPERETRKTRNGEARNRTISITTNPRSDTPEANALRKSTSRGDRFRVVQEVIARWRRDADAPLEPEEISALPANQRNRRWCAKLGRALTVHGEEGVKALLEGALETHGGNWQTSLWEIAGEWAR